MKCSKCGALIPAGSLYCESCGEDIHIVPDFEPEIEYNMEQSLSGILEELKDASDEEFSEGLEDSGDGKDTLRKKMIALGALAALLITAIVIVGIGLFRYNSVTVQVDAAVRCVESGQYDRAVGYYKRALELDKDNVDLKFAISEVYFLKNNKIEYEYMLRDIVSNPGADREQLESAYGKLIAIYRAREDYATINSLLLASGKEEILTKYQSYVAMNPEFSIPEGYYSTIQPLKLTALGKGDIYYTTDGSIPDENSMLYTAPILLDDGDYQITACFINEYGIASECVKQEYHIEIEALPIPEVGAVSGEYNYPIYIEMLGDAEEIYYTTDGNIPTLSSPRYTEPIPMPFGKSNFKFIRLKDGRSSEVVERSYYLNMNTDYLPSDAEAVVIKYSVSIGKTNDYSGHFSNNSDESYKYQFQYVININEIDDFFVIAEVYCDTNGGVTKTGSYYAVNAYTAELFKLQIDDNNNYSLVEIENVSY